MRSAAHLASDVFKAGWTDEGKANDEDVGLGVGQGSETVIVLLTSCVPQAKTDDLPIDHYLG